MICAHCSAEMPDISSFCPGCGEPVRASQEQFAADTATDSVLGAIAYLAAVPAIVLLLVPATREKTFLRFHACQSLLLAVGTVLLALILRLLYVILPVIPVIGFLFAWLLVGVSAIGIAVLWAVLVVKAALGGSFELPFLGAYAVRWAGK